VFLLSLLFIMPKMIRNLIFICLKTDIYLTIAIELKLTYIFMATAKYINCNKMKIVFLPIFRKDE